MANSTSRSKSREMESINPKVSAMDVAAKKLLSIIDTGYSERQLLADKDSNIQRILNEELDLAKGISKGSIVDFVTGLAKDSATRNGRDPNEVDGYNLFTEDVGSIFGYFQELYKNRYIEIADLNFLSKFIPALGEAVKTTLDAIVSADDFSTSITRNLVFSSTLTDSEKATAQAEIERIEEREHLLKKLRNVVYKKALVSGTHYIYCVPYSELFAEYDRLVKEGRIRDNELINNSIARGSAAYWTKQERTKGFLIGNKNSGFRATESTEDFEYVLAPEHRIPEGASVKPEFNGFCNESYQIAQEAIQRIGFYVESQDEKEKKEFEKGFESELINAFQNVFVADTDYLVEALEGFSSADILRNNIRSYRESYGGNMVFDDKNVNADANLDPNAAKPEKFDTQGSYIKYIDANHLVPCRIYNQIIGYFHVHDMTVKKKAATMQMGTSQTNIIAKSSNLFSSTTLGDEGKQKASNALINAIADGIIANFSNKFVNKNSDFKKLIADCIVANGFVNNTFQIQFIPAKYIYAFPVNEDENGLGQSILQDAIFPAKMLLSLIVSKLLFYMNKSGSKTIAYVRRGPIDSQNHNHVQRVIRMLQESSITFSDLLSSNLAFAKFSRFGNLQLPMSKNGERLIDFEVQDGQEVDLRTPMEEFLEKLSIMGTGVPSVIMEYTDAADYAKSLVTANIKFAGRCASLQSDLEEPTTEFYKALIETSGLNEDLKGKVINGFEFKLARPRVLANMNMSDYVSQLDGLARQLATLFLGENPEGEDAEKVRQYFIKQVSTKLLPFIQWDEFEEIVREAKINVSKEKDLDKKSDDMSEDEEEEY